VEKIVAISTRKAFDKIQYPFMIIFLVKRISLTSKGIQKKEKRRRPNPPTNSIILNGEKLENFSLR
jgi:hypothetical protein